MVAVIDCDHHRSGYNHLFILSFLLYYHDDQPASPRDGDEEIVSVDHYMDYKAGVLVQQQEYSMHKNNCESFPKLPF